MAFAPAIGIAAAAGGAVVSAFGNYMQGQDTAAMYNYRAGVAQTNAMIEKQNADYAIQAGEVKAQQEGMKVRAQVGQIRADQGASGLDVGSGSAALVQQSAKEIGAEDVAIIRSDAAKRAYGYDVSAYQYGTQESLDKFAASTSKTSGDIAAIGSLLGGASSVSSKWMQGQSLGMFG